MEDKDIVKHFDSLSSLERNYQQSLRGLTAELKEHETNLYEMQKTFTNMSLEYHKMLEAKHQSMSNLARNELQTMILYVHI